MMGQITKLTLGCNDLCMRCNPKESVKLACVILLFEGNDVTVKKKKQTSLRLQI